MGFPDREEDFGDAEDGDFRAMVEKRYRRRGAKP